MLIRLLLYPDSAWDSGFRRSSALVALVPVHQRGLISRARIDADSDKRRRIINTSPVVADVAAVSGATPTIMLARRCPRAPRNNAAGQPYANPLHHTRKKINDQYQASCATGALLRRAGRAGVGPGIPPRRTSVAIVAINAADAPPAHSGFGCGVRGGKSK